MIKLKYTIAIVFMMIFESGQSQNLKIDNTLPMFGEVEKSEKYKVRDQEFINECLTQYGSIDSSVNVHIDFGWRYFYNNDLKTAMKRFNQAWLLNPEFPDSYFGFAALLEMQNKNKEAIRYYDLGINKDQTKNRTQICYQRIADCKEQLKDISGTIKAYENITLLNPSNLLAYKKIGYLQMQSKNVKEAMEAYNKCILLDPNDPVTYNNRGYLNQTIGEYDLAIIDYTKAIELNPKYISALVNRGISNLHLNKFIEAEVDFEKCIKLDSKSPELKRFLGLAQLNLNKISKACSNFKLAKQMGDSMSIKLLNENCKK